MKQMLFTICVLIALGAGACAGAKDAATTSTAQRIGVYDSRAVAVAYCGSARHEAQLATLKSEYDAAQKAGDKAKMEECQKRGRDSQALMHRQGFGTASVADILALYPDEIKALKEKLGVSELVSKWDGKTLNQYKDADKVDVTADLIEIPKPKDHQRKSAQEIQKSKPLTDAQLDRMNE
ncbi:MAG: hypothetical protein ABFD69_03395 [Candidatus Sumerlaeia bacterium]